MSNILILKYKNIKIQVSVETNKYSIMYQIKNNKPKPINKIEKII